MASTDLITMEALETGLRSTADYIDNAKDMVYAYPNTSPMYSAAWLSSIPNDTKFEHVITPQPGTIYIVQDSSGLAKSARMAMLYDRDIKLYRLLDCNVANNFEVRTLSESEEIAIPNLWIDGNKQVAAETTHYSKLFKAGDHIDVYFDFDTRYTNNSSWVNNLFVRVTAGSQSFYYPSAYRAYASSYPRTFSQSFSFEEDTTLTISYRKSLSSSGQHFTITNGKITAYTLHYDDYESDHYIAPTETRQSFAGKLPPAQYNASEPSVFLSTGEWVPISELKTMLGLTENTEPQTEP